MPGCWLETWISHRRIINLRITVWSLNICIWMIKVSRSFLYELVEKGVPFWGYVIDGWPRGLSAGGPLCCRQFTQMLGSDACQGMQPCNVGNVTFRWLSVLFTFSNKILSLDREKRPCSWLQSLMMLIWYKFVGLFLASLILNAWGFFFFMATAATGQSTHHHPCLVLRGAEDHNLPTCWQRQPTLLKLCVGY